MYKIKVSRDILEYCANQVAQYNFGNVNMPGKGGKQQEFIGIAGQCVVARELDYPFPCGGTGFDGGIDVIFNGVKIDVKTMSRRCDTKPEFVNNLWARQLKFHPDCYIFCSYNYFRNEVTICGVISKKKFLEKATFNPAGSERPRDDGKTFHIGLDQYEIHNYDLIDVTCNSSMRKAVLSCRSDITDDYRTRVTGRWMDKGGNDGFYRKSKNA